MLGPITKLLKALQSDASPWQLAWGFSLGMVLGITPLWLPSVAVFLLILVLRVNVGASLAGWAIFGGLALLLAPWAHQLGEWWLLHPEWASFWTSMYQYRLWQVAHFHHTLTLGSWVFAVVLFVPTAFFGRAMVPILRTHVLPTLQRYHLLRTSKGAGLFSRVAGFWRG